MEMIFKNLFEEFNENGQLCLPERTISFGDIPWCAHTAFQGVELKHIVTSESTGGAFSYHLVRIAPNKTIGSHIHEKQLETHEIIAGSGFCMSEDAKLTYKPGVIAILPSGLPHEVTAGDEGLYLFAKFMPALL